MKLAGKDDQSSPSCPSYRHPEYCALAPVWKQCRDAATGQRAIKAGTTDYLPKLEGQDARSYHKYLSRASFFNATGRTIDGMAGLIFRKKPVVDVPDGMKDWLADINLAGRSLDGMAHDAVEEVIKVGRAGLLGDFPQAPPVEAGTALTVEQARQMSLRPYICLYEAEDIIDWTTGRVGNATKYISICLLESYTDTDGKTAPQVRELSLDGGTYSQIVWRMTVKEKVWFQFGEAIVPLKDAKPLVDIPFWFLAPVEPDDCVAEPPVEDLVYINIAHYRNSADLENGMHLSGLPTPWISGHSIDKGQKVYLGSDTIIVMADPAARAGFMQVGADGFTSLEKGMDRKEQQMAALGARLIAPEKKGVEAAETAQIRRGGENSVLGSIAAAVEMQFNKALTFIADWGKITGNVVYTLNRMFLPANMTPQMMTALVQAWQSGALSEESFFEALQAGDMVSEGLDFQTEKTRKLEGGPALGKLGKTTTGDPTPPGG